MGNTPSKDGAPLSRSNTNQSTRSNKSSRSLRSKKNDSSTSLSKMNKKPLSRKNSSVSVDNANNNSNGNNNNNSNNNNGNGNVSGSYSNYNDSNLNLSINNDDGLGSIPTDFNNLNIDSSNLPPSMMQIEPKQPILIRRNTDMSVDLSNISNSNTVGNSPVVTPFDENGPNNSNGSGNGNGLLSVQTTGSISNSPLGTPSEMTFNTNNDDTNDNENNDNNNNNNSNSNSNSNDDDNNNGTNGTSNDNTLTIENNNIGGGDDERLSRTSTNHSIASMDDELKSLSKSRSNSSFLSGRLLKTNSNILTRNSTSNSTGTFDIENLIQRLLDLGYSGKRTKNVCLKNNEIAMICAKSREIFLSQPSLLELNPPVNVVGDVHGQYGDLIRIFTKCGFPPSANYLFLGDYVDRGKQSLETILLLLCYKIKYPENFFLLRGNHECANVTRVYGFYDECKRRTNIKTWKLFIDTFNTLPIAAIVAGKIFCVHGGLSPVLSSLDDIRNIARPTDVPDFGLLNDLLWSDPADILNEWEDNERGVSYVFSKIAINKFLSKFGFDLVCRAHMVVEDGYEFFNDQTLVTVFLAPNYCGEFDNWGAVMCVSEELLCSFDLLDPLDSIALKQVMKKGKQERKLAQSRL